MEFSAPEHCLPHTLQIKAFWKGLCCDSSYPFDADGPGYSLILQTMAPGLKGDTESPLTMQTTTGSPAVPCPPGVLQTSCTACESSAPACSAVEGSGY